MPSISSHHSPRWYGVAPRVVLLTFLGTLLCFAVTLLLAILGTVIVAALHRVHPDMRVAYRHIAVPLGIVEGSIVFVIALIHEIRHYRQARALLTLERMS